MPEVGAHRDPLFDRLLSIASDFGLPAALQRIAEAARTLRNMEQGARSLGGKVTVNTDSGDTGTVVEWRVPVGR